MDPKINCYSFTGRKTLPVLSEILDVLWQIKYVNGSVSLMQLLTMFHGSTFYLDGVRKLFITSLFSHLQ